MVDPREREPGPNGRQGVDRRPPRSRVGLYIAGAIAVAILLAFLLVDAGWREPSSDVVAPDGEEPFTEAPSQTQLPRAEVPEEAPADAQVRPEPSQDGASQGQ